MLLPTAANFVPSAEEATESHCPNGELVGDQVAPEFVEVKIMMTLLAATILVPSAEEATASRPGTLVIAVQVALEFVET